MALSLNSWIYPKPADLKVASPAKTPKNGAKRRVMEALKGGPMTLAQIAKQTGLTKDQVREVFRASLGKCVYSEPVKYRLLPQIVGVD